MYKHIETTTAKMIPISKNDPVKARKSLWSSTFLVLFASVLFVAPDRINAQSPYVTYYAPAPVVAYGPVTTYYAPYYAPVDAAMPVTGYYPSVPYTSYYVAPAYTTQYRPILGRTVARVRYGYAPTVIYR